MTNMCKHFFTALKRFRLKYLPFVLLPRELHALKAENCLRGVKMVKQQFNQNRARYKQEITQLQQALAKRNKEVRKFKEHRKEMNRALGIIRLYIDEYFELQENHSNVVRTILDSKGISNKDRQSVLTALKNMEAQQRFMFTCVDDADTILFEQLRRRD